MAAKKTAKKSTVKADPVNVEPVKVETVKAAKKVLMACRPLLYDGREYKTGEIIPHRGEKVDAWIKDGSAEWV